MGLIAVSFNVTPQRQVKLGFPSVLLLLSLITLAASFLYYKLIIVFYLCIGFTAIKVMAERLPEDFEKKLGYVLTLFCGLSVIYVWLQHQGLDPIYQKTFQDEGGTFGRPWALGSMAVMAIPFIWNIKKWLIVLPLILVFQSHSVVCVGAAFIVIALLLPRKWSILALVACVCSVSGYIAYEGGIEPHRIQVWKNIWPYAMETPFLGHGVGSFLHRGFVHFVNGEMQHQPWLHNEFYQCLFALGFAGLGVLVLWVASMLTIENKIVRAAVIGLCIVCCFHPVMHWGRLIFFGCLIITLAEIAKKQMVTYGRRY